MIYCEYPGIFFRTLEKTIVEEKLKENPRNYALKEYFSVLEKIHFDFRIHAKFKISDEFIKHTNKLLGIDS